MRESIDRLSTLLTENHNLTSEIAVKNIRLRDENVSLRTLYETSKAASEKLEKLTESLIATNAELVRITHDLREENAEIPELKEELRETSKELTPAKRKLLSEQKEVKRLKALFERQNESTSEPGPSSERPK